MTPSPCSQLAPSPIRPLALMSRTRRQENLWAEYRVLSPRARGARSSLCVPGRTPSSLSSTSWGVSSIGPGIIEVGILRTTYLAERRCNCAYLGKKSVARVWGCGVLRVRSLSSAHTNRARFKRVLTNSVLTSTLARASSKASSSDGAPSPSSSSAGVPDSTIGAADGPRLKSLMGALVPWRLGELLKTITLHQTGPQTSRKGGSPWKSPPSSPAAPPSWLPSRHAPARCGLRQYFR